MFLTTSLLHLLVFKKHESVSGTFVTGKIGLTVGLYCMLECIKAGDGHFELDFMNNFHFFQQHRKQTKPK